MSIKYIVKTPIHGYSGMGYESMPVLRTEFDTLEAAKKCLCRFNKVYKINYALKCGEKEYLSDREEAFMRAMQDNVSYSVEGTSFIVKQTVVEEPVYKE